MGVKFGGWAPNRHYKNIDKLKFGSLVWDLHMYTVFISNRTHDPITTRKFNSRNYLYSISVIVLL